MTVTARTEKSPSLFLVFVLKLYAGKDIQLTFDFCVQSDFEAWASTSTLPSGTSIQCESFSVCVGPNDMMCHVDMSTGCFLVPCLVSGFSGIPIMPLGTCEEVEQKNHES